MYRATSEPCRENYFWIRAKDTVLNRLTLTSRLVDTFVVRYICKICPLSLPDIFGPQDTGGAVFGMMGYLEGKFLATRLSLNRYKGHKSY